MLDQLIEVISYLAVVSIAAERFTEILKGALLKRLFAGPVTYQLTAGVFGGFLAFIAPSPMAHLLDSTTAIIVVTGLAVSGGSGFWNSVLSVMQDFNNKRKA